MLKFRFVFLLMLAFGFAVSTSGINAQEVADEKWTGQDEKVDLPSLFQKAGEDISAEDFKAAAKKLKKYTKAKDDNGQAWFLLAYSLHMDGQIDEAIPMHKKAVKFPAFRSTALYNLGCAYSLKNDSDKSLDYLHKALDEGFDRFEMLESDEDLVNVRKAEGFSEIKARAENNGDRIEKKVDTKGLVGKWAVTSGSRAGDDIDAERLPPEITFTKKDVTIPAGETTFVMSYKVVDSDKDVVHVDFTIESGPAEGSAKGILKMDGKKAKLCYDPTGENRPKDFKTSEDNGFFLFVMDKKANKEKKADKDKKPAKFDASKIPGKWQVTKGTRAGEEVGEDRLGASVITFEKDKITIPGDGDSFVMSYTINADASPIQIDMKVESGPAPEGSAAVGILRLNKGKFVLCYNPMGGDRPKKFESTEENGCFLFVMKPAKD